MARKVYEELAALAIARKNCIERNNTVWEANHSRAFAWLVRNALPSGSGIDCGTKCDIDDCNDQVLKFTVPYHCMDDNGFYCGWRDYTVYVKPSLQFGFSLRITGRDYNGIKEYLYDIYRNDLMKDADFSDYPDRDPVG